MKTDAELLECYVRDRSEPAFTELVRRHVDLVYSAALRQTRGDAHRAHDIAQLVFTDLARRARQLTNHTALRGWLYTATHFAAAKQMRTEQRRQAREREAHAMQAIDRDAAIDWDRIRPVLDDAMHALDDRDRHAVILRFFDGRSMTEIGTALNLSESAARRLTDRALEALRELLARRGITSTAAALGSALAANSVLAAPAGEIASVSGAALDAIAASAPATPSLLQFANANKIALAVLGASMALNLLLWQGSAPQADAMDPVVAATPAAPAGAFVPPATPIVADFNDPRALALKLHAEGYSERVIRYTIFHAVMAPRQAELDALIAPHQAALDQRPRWQPRPLVSGDANGRHRAVLQAIEAQSESIVDGLFPRETP